MIVSGEEESFVWLVTKQEPPKWYRVGVSLKSVSENVQALRCGLDEEEWIGIERPYRCMQLLGLKEKPGDKQPLPFDLQISHDLFLKFFDQASRLISDKRLPGRNLRTVVELAIGYSCYSPAIKSAAQNLRGYDDVSWLGANSPMVVLPSVLSFKSRERLTQKSSAVRSYTGFGNPSLATGDCSRPNIRQTCARATVASAGDTVREAFPEKSAERGLHPGNIIGNGASEASLVAAIRSLCRLPDTAFEIECVAKMVGASGEDLHLGTDATKATLQGLNESGVLAQY